MSSTRSLGSSSPVTINNGFPDRTEAHIEHYSPGIIGTKRGTFILDTNLNVETIQVPVEKYDEYLKNSIDYGFDWLNKYIFIDEGKKKLTMNKFKKGPYYNEECNQQLIDICYGWKKKIGASSSPIISPKVESNFSEYNVWTHKSPMRYSGFKFPSIEEEKISESVDIFYNHANHVNDYNIEDINLSNGYLVMGPNGESEIFINIKHKNHYDILPLSFLCEKFPELKTAFHGTYQLLK